MKLNALQVGRYAEYLAKMEFAKAAFEVFSSEVDDRGIDFVARGPAGTFTEVQVKSKRGSGYVFMKKTTFPLTPERAVAIAWFRSGETPEFYVVPSMAWSQPFGPFKSRDFQGGKSEPEWGLELNAKHAPALEQFRFPAPKHPLVLASKKKS